MELQTVRMLEMSLYNIISQSHSDGVVPTMIGSPGREGYPGLLLGDGGHMISPSLERFSLPIEYRRKTKVEKEKKVEENVGRLGKLTASIFPSMPNAWTLSNITDHRSLAIMALSAALYVMLRAIFAAIGGHGAVSFRPADSLIILTVLFGWPWGIGIMLGGFVSAYFPMTGGYGFIDALKQLLVDIIAQPILIWAYKRYDPHVSKFWFFILANTTYILWSGFVVGIYLNILYEIPIIAFVIGCLPTAFLNQGVLSAILIRGLKARGAHFLPARSD